MNAGGNFELPYDDPEELVESNGLEEHSARSGERPMPVRGSIEKTWASLAKITAAFQSQVGAIVGWKELGINPRTYTPEVLLNIGRVVKNDEQLVLEPVFEEKETEVCFAGAIVTREDTFEQAYDWKDVLQGEWRIAS